MVINVSEALDSDTAEIVTVIRQDPDNVNDLIERNFGATGKTIQIPCPPNVSQFGNCYGPNFDRSNERHMELTDRVVLSSNNFLIRLTTQVSVGTPDNEQLWAFGNVNTINGSIFTQNFGTIGRLTWSPNSSSSSSIFADVYPANDTSPQIIEAGREGNATFLNFNGEEVASGFTPTGDLIIDFIGRTRGNETDGSIYNFEIEDEGELVYAWSLVSKTENENNLSDGLTPGYNQGIYRKGRTKTFKTVASVQQPTPKELEMMPSGEREKDVRKFISTRPLRTTQDKDGVIADIVLYKGNRYKLIRAADWQEYGHTTVFGTRESKS